MEIPAADEDEELRKLQETLRRLGPADGRKAVHYARFREMEGRKGVAWHYERT